MDINDLELISSFILNSLDFMMLYFITYALLGHRANEAFKTISLKIVLLMFVFGVIMGTIHYLFDVMIHNAVATVFMLGVVHIVAKRISNIPTPDKVLIIVCHYILIHTLIIPILLVMSPLGLGLILRNLLVYLVLTSLYFFLCMKIDLNKLFTFVSRRVLVKIMFFSITIIFISVFAIFNFDADYVLQSSAVFIVFMTVTVNCLYLTLKSAHEYMEVMPDTYHDTKELLTILNHKLEDINDVEQMRLAYKRVMSLMELKVTPDVNSNYENEFESFILKTMDSIKANKGSQVPLIADIDYYEPHATIDDVEIAYMLGILFKNAVETLTNKPILVDVMSSKYSVLIKVSNEAKHKSKEELEAMLMKSYSSKKSIGRGFGLAKLKKLVEKKKGKLSIFQEFNHGEQLNYLTIMIRF